MDFAFTVIFILVLGYEALALRSKRLGDTISEKNVSLREWRPPVGRMLFDSFYVWYGYHIFIDPIVGDPRPAASWIDLVLVAMVALGTFLWWALNIDLARFTIRNEEDPPTPKG